MKGLLRVVLVGLIGIGVVHAGDDYSETSAWQVLGRMEHKGGGSAVPVEYLVGSIRYIRGVELGGEQFSDIMIGRFRLGEQWNTIVPIEVCKVGEGKISVINTEVLRLYPGLDEYQIQTILQNSASGGGGNVRMVNFNKLVDPVAMSAKWLCLQKR